MLKNYLKTAIRNLRKYKGYSFINITGFAIGIACCILIMLWVADELSFDAFHGKSDRLFRVVEEQPYAGGEIFRVAVTPGPLGPSLEEEYPEVAAACRLTIAPRFLIRYGDKRFYESGLGMADPSFWKMFDFPLVKGDRERVFARMNSIVISESAAEKYFGDEDPLEKSLRLENMFDLIVSGVMEDVPENSHLQFDFVMPFKLLEFGGQRIDVWGNNSFYTYVELAENVDPVSADEKIRSAITKHLPESDTTCHLQPLRRIHLHSDYVADLGGHGDIRYVYIFSLVALLVLVIACINFMNLATARSGNRAREVGMRKVSGAYRGHLIRQFLGESVLYALIAFVLALGFVFLTAPAFGRLAGKSLSLNFSQNLEMLAGLIGIAVVAGLGAGIYPAVYLSGFDPVRVLRGSMLAGPKGSLLRRTLVVGQFALSIGLIISSLVVGSQLNFIRNKRLGFDREHVVYMRLGMQTTRNFEAFRSEALGDPNILGVTTAQSLPIYIVNSTSSVNWPTKNPDDEILFHTLTVSHDFLELMDMTMAEGRAFSREFSTDGERAYILNQAGARVLGMDSPVGKPFTLWDTEGIVVGVVEDFHFKSLNTKVEPLVMRLRPPEDYSFMLVKIRGEDIPETMGRLTSIWNKVSPAFPFDPAFLDAEFDRMYRSEQRMGRIFGAFTGLAIIIACLGLLGLASFMAERRRREIGIRKVLGGSVCGIMLLMTKEFIILVATANLLAWPAAYYFMKRWLRDYAYNAGIDPFIFIGAALIAVIIAILTVSGHAYRAAASDPVDSLRYE